MPDTTIEAAIFSALTNESSISDIVAARVYAMFAPQTTELPYIIYQQISAIRDHTLDGPSGYTDSRYQLTCWATTYELAKQLFEAVRIFFDGYHATVAGVNIQYVQFENELDTFAKQPGVDVIDRYGKQIDFKITFDEATS